MANNIPKTVEEHVKLYLEENNLGELVEIRRASDNPENDYLYHVIARKLNTSKLFHHEEYTYSCFTSWNETRCSLNHGHYNLKSLKAAQDVSDEYLL